MASVSLGFSFALHLAPLSFGLHNLVRHATSCGSIAAALAAETLGADQAALTTGMTVRDARKKGFRPHGLIAKNELKLTAKNAETKRFLSCESMLLKASARSTKMKKIARQNTNPAQSGSVI